MDMSVGAVTVTVRVVEPMTPFTLAVIAVVPAATPVARPPVEIVAVAVVDEVQVAIADTSCVVPSLNVPVAVNCWVAFIAIDMLAGMTAMDVSVAIPDVTVSVVEPLTVPLAAEIVVVPAATPVARPVAEIVAVAIVDEVQVAVAEMSFVVPSLIVAVAVNCCVEPIAIDMLVGVTEIDVTFAIGSGCVCGLALLEQAVSQPTNDSKTTVRAAARTIVIFMFVSFCVNGPGGYRSAIENGASGEASAVDFVESPTLK
jgi:hypothetical protein